MDGLKDVMEEIMEEYEGKKETQGTKMFGEFIKLYKLGLLDIKEMTKGEDGNYTVTVKILGAVITLFIQNNSVTFYRVEDDV